MSYRPAPLGNEWDDVARHVQDEVLSRLTAMGSDESLRTHVLHRLAPLRLLYVATLWIDNDALRREVAVGVGLHMAGVNLIDDLLDQDSGQASTELICAGSFLLQSGAAVLCALIRSGTGWEEERCYLHIFRSTLEELRKRPESLQEWVDLARVKAGEVLECYVALACLAAGKQPRHDVERSLARALGFMFMVRDDWTDFWTRHEEQGNLFWLLTEGRADMTTVRQLVDDAVSTATRAMSADPLAAHAQWLLEEQQAMIEERLERFVSQRHSK